MDALRFFNMLALVIIAVFFIQHFTSVPDKSEVILPSVYLSTDKSEIVVPNIPKVTLYNNFTGSLTIDTCKDISLSINNQPTTDISKAYPEFCRTHILASGETYSIHMDALYPVFAKYPGQYQIILKHTQGEAKVDISLVPPGALRHTLSVIVYQPIYNLFVGILTWIPSHQLGWAIIILTIIIRLILLVPQQHMLESQKKLQKIKPKITEIQEKYKDDKAVLGQKMLELYKAEQVNPMGSCLPLLVQMPILIGLYWVISGITDTSNFYYLYSIFSTFQPSQIDTIFLGINLSQTGGITAIVFGIILGIAQWVQVYLSNQYNANIGDKNKNKKSKEISNNTEPVLDPEMMQKMMLYVLPVMLAVSAYFFPLGVGLYWFIGTIFLIAQQYYTNKKQ